MRSLIVILGAVASLGLGLFWAGLGILGWIQGGEMHVPLLPTEPDSAATGLFVAGFYATLAALLSLRRSRVGRFLLLLLSLGLVVVLGYAVFSATYRFDGLGGFGRHLLLLLGSLVLLWSTWLGFRSPGGRDDLSHVVRPGAARN